MRIGIDLGGTKVEGAAIDDDGNVVCRRRVATPREDYEATVAAIAAVVREIEAEVRVTATVGVGTPGTISPATGLIKNANSTWLNGRPLGADLERTLGRPIRLANDANCFALSEAIDGAGASAEVVFGVILGTGTGGGIVVRERPLRGPNAVAGEWGHNPLPWPQGAEWPGPSCYCGRTGCIEMFLSGPGLAREHRETTGRDWDAGEIDRAAQGGDAGAEAALVLYTSRLARALATVINVLDPDVIVLGGGLSNMARLYASVPREWGRWVFSDRVDTPLVAPRHGDTSGVRGAAWLWPRA